MTSYNNGQIKGTVVDPKSVAFVMNKTSHVLDPSDHDTEYGWKVVVSGRTVFVSEPGDKASADAVQQAYRGAGLQGGVRVLPND